eukprot:GSA120T00014620001.1
MRRTSATSRSCTRTGTSHDSTSARTPARRSASSSSSSLTGLRGSHRAVAAATTG